MSPPSVTNVDSISLRIARRQPLCPAREPGMAAPGRAVALEGPPQQRVEPCERALPARARVVAQELSEGSLAQLEPGLAARLFVELQPHVEPDSARRERDPLDILMPNEQLVLDDLGEGHVDRAAVVRVVVADHHNAPATTDPRVAVHGLVRTGVSDRTEPLAYLVSVDERPVDELGGSVEDAGDSQLACRCHAIAFLVVCVIG